MAINLEIGLDSLVSSCCVGHDLTTDISVSDVLALIMVYWITFTVVLILLFAIGFNVPGIGAGTS